jgi:hypothetical protein
MLDSERIKCPTNINNFQEYLKTYYESAKYIIFTKIIVANIYNTFSIQTLNPKVVYQKIHVAH